MPHHSGEAVTNFVTSWNYEYVYDFTFKTLLPYGYIAIIWTSLEVSICTWGFRSTLPPKENQFDTIISNNCLNVVYAAREAYRLD